MSSKNAKTGKVYWTHDLLAACWSSALLVDGKVYIGDEDGDVAVFRHSSDPNIAMKAVRLESGQSVYQPINADENGDPVSMGNSIYMTPIVANNVLYIATRSTL
ncbi:MAG: PQQ-binding-like beta-propeller repeat protein [Planctomycetia bacterium]|nr:PQQ-binding-like beta-propeller repeat protein [Planctomycetia bacterium]